MTTQLLEPDRLRPALLEKVQQLDASDLVLLQEVLLRLERDRVFSELTAEFSQDRQAGKFEDLENILLQARENLRAG